MRERKPDTDNQINVADLKAEFREYPSTIFAWLEAKADAESRYEIQKAFYKETRASVYVAIKTRGEKVTESHVDAMIETNDQVKGAAMAMYQAKRDLETLENYVESLRGKKDMLIQLGADARKEL